MFLFFQSRETSANFLALVGIYLVTSRSAGKLILVEVDQADACLGIRDCLRSVALSLNLSQVQRDYFRLSGDKSFETNNKQLTVSRVVINVDDDSVSSSSSSLVVVFGVRNKYI